MTFVSRIGKIVLSLLARTVISSTKLNVIFAFQHIIRIALFLHCYLEITT